MGAKLTAFPAAEPEPEDTLELEPLLFEGTIGRNFAEAALVMAELFRGGADAAVTGMAGAGPLGVMDTPV